MVTIHPKKQKTNNQILVSKLQNYVCYELFFGLFYLYRCWLNYEKGFIWSFLGPVCCILGVSCETVDAGRMYMLVGDR